VLINAFLNAAEIASISMRRARIKQLADEGTRSAERVQRLVENPRKFIATVQVGVTLTAFFASAFGAVSLVEGVRGWLEGSPLRLDHTTADSVAFVFVTVADAFVVLIFGELVPKTLGIERAEPIALRVAGFVGIMARLLGPVVVMLTATTNLVVRLFGSTHHGSLPSITEAEIMSMVETGEDEGVVTASEQEMIRNIFEFTDRRVSEIMVPRPDMYELSANMTIAEAGPHIRKTGYARIPIYDGDRENIIGMVYAKDVLGAYIEGHTEQTLRAIAHPLVFVPETKLVGELLKELQRGRQNMAIAVDEFGGVSGLLTLEDLLEEIVGDIQDEFQHEEAPIEEIGQGELRVAGNLSLADIVERLGLRIRDTELDITVAALILEEQGRIPEPGDSIFWHDIRLTVDHMERRRISKVHVKYEGPPVEEPSEDRAEAAPLH
jgi:putative hemolysin